MPSRPTRGSLFAAAFVRVPVGWSGAEIDLGTAEIDDDLGDAVQEGDTVAILESMKMEIPVLAESAGTVTKVNVAVGDVIQAGDLIAVIS